MAAHYLYNEACNLVFFFHFDEPRCRKPFCVQVCASLVVASLCKRTFTAVLAQCVLGQCMLGKRNQKFTHVFIIRNSVSRIVLIITIILTKNDTLHHTSLTKLHHNYDDFNGHSSLFYSITTSHLQIPAVQLRHKNGLRNCTCVNFENGIITSP